MSRARRVHFPKPALRDVTREGIDPTTARAHCTNNCTVGATVRFFSLTNTTGHGRLGKSIGKTFRPCFALRWSIEPGTAATKRPEASNWLRRATENVSTLILGTSWPMAANASFTSKTFQLLGGSTQGAPANSASSIL